MIALHLKTKIILIHIYNTFTVPCEKSKTVSFASSIVKETAVFSALSIFAVKLICWIALGSISIAYSLLEFIAIFKVRTFIYSKDNLINNQLYNNLLDQYQLF